MRTTKPIESKTYPQEIIDALDECDAIQPPSGFYEYWRLHDQAETKLDAVCKKYGLDPLCVEVDLGRIELPQRRQARAA
jgi:hypothetical protein